VVPGLARAEAQAAKYDVLCSIMTEAVLVLDSDGRYVHIEDTKGVPKEVRDLLLGTRLADGFPPEVAGCKRGSPPGGATMTWLDPTPELGFQEPSAAWRIVCGCRSLRGATLAGGGDTYRNKLRTSLLNTLAWLETHAPAAIAALPADRQLSFLEVTLLCLVTHLEFRDVVPVTPYPQLGELCRELTRRPSIATTTYHFDP